jgi:adenylosuccinate synthase
MPLDIIVGTQWGDEGKGRFTDLLAADVDIVARYSGGDNAGHTVTIGDQIFKLHLVPSGIVHHGPICLMGNGMVVNPAKLLSELDRLAQSGVDISPNRLKLSSAAHIITPAHIALDGAEEAQRGGHEIGTTRRGIGPAYTDKASRRGVRAGSMRDPAAFGKQVECLVQRVNRQLEEIYAASTLDPRQAGREYAGYAERLRPYIADIGSLIASALAQGKSVLAEGAQGTLLDLDHGTYPYVTSSTPVASGALVGLGIGPGHVRHIIGVTKAFQTRVGGGPFPTELHGEVGGHLRGTGKNPWDEFGTTTGRPRRCGWLDGVLLRYATRVNGLTELAITKLDILSGLDPLRLCTSYRQGEGSYEDLPDNPADLSPYRACYQDLPGWQADLTGVRTWRDLPGEARRYVGAVEALAGLRASRISVGPERDQVILRAGAD